MCNFIFTNIMDYINHNTENVYFIWDIYEGKWVKINLLNYICTCSVEGLSLGIRHQDDLLLHTAYCNCRSESMGPWSWRLVYNITPLLFVHPHLIHSFISHHFISTILLFVTLLYRIVNVYLSYQLLRQGGQRT